MILTCWRGGAVDVDMLGWWWYCPSMSYWGDGAVVIYTMVLVAMVVQ